MGRSSPYLLDSSSSSSSSRRRCCPDKDLLKSMIGVGWRLGELREQMGPGLELLPLPPTPLHHQTLGLSLPRLRLNMRLNSTEWST